MHTSFRNIKTEAFELYEDVTDPAPTLSSFGVSRLDSSSNAIAATLGDPEWVNAIGRIKTIVMVDATNASTVTIAHHETSDPEVINFSAVDDMVMLMWTGTEWVTIKRSGATV
jgi:hypothetical protein